MLRGFSSIVGWLVILLGVNTLAFAIAGLVARISAGHAGGVMSLDLRTPTYFGAAISVAIACVILAAGIWIRAASSRTRE